MPAPASRQEFAALINDARRQQHLSIRAVARIAEVPPTTAQGWLNGKHFPTPALRGNYLVLLEHLGLAELVPDDLWEDSWGGVQPALKSGQAPYLGLRPYRVGDQALFFGRDAQSGRVAAAIRELSGDTGRGLLALVGPSGSGKSSLLAAGVLGREVTAGSLAGWTGVSIPVIRLLAGAGSVPDGESGRRFVVVDQFEEALALPDQPRRQALEALASVAGHSVVILGLRSDAFAAASLEPTLEPAMSRPILLSPMTRAELHEVIVRPAESLGVAVDDDLVKVLLEELAPGADDSRVAPGTLPLLSNAMLLVWAVSGGHRLTLADYHTAGGVAGAVERLAEQVYTSLDPVQQEASERLLLRLARVAGGDVVVREALPLAEVDATTRPALDAFVAARMLTTVDDEVRISHQALLSHWSRLNGWLAEHGDDLAVMEKLRLAAEVWADSGRDPAALIPVKRLALFTEWLTSGSKQRLLTDAEREFVAASEAHFALARASELATLRRERRWLRLALGLGAVAVLLAVVVAVLLLRE